MFPFAEWHYKDGQGVVHRNTKKFLDLLDTFPVVLHERPKVDNANGREVAAPSVSTSSTTKTADSNNEAKATSRCVQELSDIEADPPMPSSPPIPTYWDRIIDSISEGTASLNISSLRSTDQDSNCRVEDKIDPYIN